MNMQPIDLNVIIPNLIRQYQPSSQEDLQQLLQKHHGICITQASISRTLKKKNIRKISGCYRLPEIPSTWSAGEVSAVKITPVADHLLVIKTEVGSAARIAYLIDNAAIPGIAGTISGDDTIFLAILGKDYQSNVIEQILTHFSQSDIQ